MKSVNLILFFLFVQIYIYIPAQSVSDFENLTVGNDGFLNGSDGSGGFTSGNVFLPNNFDATFEVWSGWAISNSKNDSTPGFLNQYGAITAGGFEGSENYAVSFSFGPNTIRLKDNALGQPISGLYVTNGTYPFLSMRDGDAFAKKFGGATGDDPDFFMLTIKKWSGGLISVDSVDFYLADYRSSDNNKDYIVADWNFVDLTSLGHADSLSLSLSSSDVGQFGMNTPAYFCVDNIETTGMTTSEFNTTTTLLNVYPNPTSHSIFVNHITNEPIHYQLFDLNGHLLMQKTVRDSQIEIDISSWLPGTYLLQSSAGKIKESYLVMKE